MSKEFHKTAKIGFFYSLVILLEIKNAENLVIGGSIL